MPHRGLGHYLLRSLVRSGRDHSADLEPAN
jgi:hypothetical protein